MQRKRMLFVCALGLILAAAPASGQPGETAGAAPPALPPARQIPGISAADLHPNACVDCHINNVETGRDDRLSTVLALFNGGVEPGLLATAQAAAPAGVVLRGRHPKVSGIFDDIPGKCLNCHGRDSEQAPPFSRLLHGIHLGGGGENPFLTVYQGECTHCHKLDQASGQWRIPSGPER